MRVVQNGVVRHAFGSRNRAYLTSDDLIDYSLFTAQQSQYVTDFYRFTFLVNEYLRSGF